MYYKIELSDHIRVPPKLFHLPTKEAVIQRIKKKYDGFISKDFGIVVDVADVKDVTGGTVIAGDGAAYYSTTFDLYVFKPELQEVVTGGIRDIADFGAFINIGPIEGMIHVSQTMDDFVSFSKDKVLVGKETKRALKVGDRVKARLIAISYKDVQNPKLGLTMRQPFMGKQEWIDEDAARKAGKPETVEKKGKKGAEK
jgi:DNA-directed RNA polymerase subunit E'